MKRPDALIVAVAADLVEASQELDLSIDQVAHEASQYARHLRKVAYAAKVRELRGGHLTSSRFKNTACAKP